MQCADLPCFIVKNWFGIDLWGNAIDLLNSASAQGLEVIYNAPGVNPKASDLFVMEVAGSPYGHTGAVIEDSDGYTIKTVEQNIDGNWDSLQVGGPARFNIRDFTGVIGWIRLPVDHTHQTVDTAPQNSDTIVETAKTGTFTLDVAEINIRRWPSLASEVVGSYKQGDTVNFDSEGYANGYYWISYVGDLGMRNYLAIGQTDKDGNRISIWGKLN
ncbi:bacterial SH3 domain protein [Streptococcus pyogenes]|nr:bacterial SH3 domain protein [Streptococcus pyogenes]